jgi:hypothetical protein
MKQELFAICYDTETDGYNYVKFRDKACENLGWDKEEYEAEVINGVSVALGLLVTSVGRTAEEREMLLDTVTEKVSDVVKMVNSREGIE